MRLRVFISIAILIFCFRTSPATSTPVIRFQGETIDFQELEKAYEKAAEVKSRFSGSTTWETRQEYITSRLIDTLKSRIHDMLVREHPPSETDVESAFEDFLARGLIPAWTEDQKGYNELLYEMLQTYFESSDESDERLHRIFVDHQERFPQSKPLNEHYWKMFSFTADESILNCTTCLPVTGEAYAELNKKWIRRYLVRRSVARERIVENDYANKPDLHSRVNNVLEGIRSGGSRKGPIPEVKDALMTALLEREWERLLLEEIDAGLSIEGDPEFLQRFEEIKAKHTAKTVDIENYENEFFLPW